MSTNNHAETVTKLFKLDVKVVIVLTIINMIYTIRH